MLLDIFRGEGTLGQKLTTAIFMMVITLISLTVHEVSHGYAAYKCGDPTARNFGRLSLNPVKHLDPIGALSMLIFGFGWAKPVPINTRYFKKPRRDMAISAFAGPLSNVVMSFIACFLMMLCQLLYVRLYLTAGEFLLRVIVLLYEFFFYFHWMNLTLAVFNMIPVPPLDGSRILLIFLPAKYYFGVMKYERYISMGIMLLLFTGVLSAPLTAVVSAISSGFTWLWGLLPIFG